MPGKRRTSVQRRNGTATNKRTKTPTLALSEDPIWEAAQSKVSEPNSRKRAEVPGGIGDTIAMQTTEWGKPLPIIAVDFDGTIVENKFPEIGRLLPHAKRVLLALAEKYQVIIWTCREGEHKEKMLQFLKDEGIIHHRTNENCPHMIEVFGGNDCRKVFANVYIDDRDYRGFLCGWLDVEQRLLRPVRMLSPDELANEMRSILENDLLAIMRRKGQGYSGKDPDTLANIRAAGITGVITRLMDKFHRMKSYVELGHSVDEDLDELLNDILNYSFYIKVMMKGK